jgi:hypothetical protein
MEMEKEGKINKELIEKVKCCVEEGKFYYDNPTPIDIPYDTNYQTFFEALRYGLPLRFVPEKMFDFNMAKLVINNHFNNVLFIPRNILNKELFDLALSQKQLALSRQDLPHLFLVKKYIPSEYLTNEVYEKYLRRDLKNNLQYVPETNLKELQNVIDEINELDIKSKYENTINNKSEKEHLFQRFDKIEEKDKNILFRLYPHLKEEYQQFIYNQSKLFKD